MENIRKVKQIAYDTMWWQNITQISWLPNSIIISWWLGMIAGNDINSYL